MEAVKRNQTAVIVVPHTELTSDQYHAERVHISSSQLIHILRTPAHYQYHANNGCVEETDLMRMGTAAHCVLLEPNEFKNRFVFAPRSYDKRKTADKGEICQIAQNYPGKTLLEPVEVATLEKLADGIRNHAQAQMLLSAPGRPENSIFWTDQLTGLNLKVRIDREVDVGPTGTMLEVKTTDDASKSAFARKVALMEYDVRAVMYADGMQQAYGFTPDIVWLVIERETGFVTTYRPSPEMLHAARERYTNARIKLANAIATNSWPAYQTGETIETIHRLKWDRR